MKTTITNFFCAIAALLIPTAALAQNQQTIDGISYLLYPSTSTAKVYDNKTVEMTNLVIPEDRHLQRYRIYRHQPHWRSFPREQ